MLLRNTQSMRLRLAQGRPLRPAYPDFWDSASIFARFDLAQHPLFITKSYSFVHPPTGDPILYHDPVAGLAVDFDGDDAYNGISASLLPANFPTLSGNGGPFTCVIYLRIPDLSAADFHNLIQHDNASGAPYFLYVKADGSIGSNMSASGNILSSSGVFPEGEWVCAASRFDGDLLEVLVNGEVVASTTGASLTTQTNNSLNYATRDNGTPPANGALVGQMAIASIWSRAMTDAELELVVADPFIAFREEEDRSSPIVTILAASGTSATLVGGPGFAVAGAAPGTLAASSALSGSAALSGASAHDGDLSASTALSGGVTHAGAGTRASDLSAGSSLSGAASPAGAGAHGGSLSASSALAGSPGRSGAGARGGTLDLDAPTLLVGPAGASAAGQAGGFLSASQVLPGAAAGSGAYGPPGFLSYGSSLVGVAASATSRASDGSIAASSALIGIPAGGSAPGRAGVLVASSILSGSPGQAIYAGPIVVSLGGAEILGLSAPAGAFGLPGTICIRGETIVDCVGDALDVARRALTDAGLRANRIYFVVETWSGARPGLGTVSRVFTELDPAPRVRSSSGFGDMQIAGQALSGRMTLDKISRRIYTREQLKGLTATGARRPANEVFKIGVQPRGQTLVHLYKPGDPTHRAHDWKMALEPTGETVAYSPTPITSDPFLDASMCLDDARQVLADIGLREWRVYLVVETWNGGTRKGQGDIRRVFTEVTPTPRARFVSTEEEMATAGRRLVGDAVLDRISRSGFTREQLKGLEADGTKRPEREAFFWGIQPRQAGFSLVSLYKVIGEPVLDNLGWSVNLRPTDIRVEHC